MPKRKGKRWKARNGRSYVSYTSALRSDRRRKKSPAALKATRRRDARRKANARRAKR